MPAITDSELPITDPSAALQSAGFDVFSVGPSAETFIRLSQKLGAELGAQDFGVSILESTGSNSTLPIHAENVSQNIPGLAGYFALGCLVTAEHGGQTTIYDARKAASIINEANPRIAKVRIAYSAAAYPGQVAVHSLIHESPDHGPVLRFRAQVETNQLHDELPGNMSEADFYDIVDEALGESIIAEHSWQPGDFLVVNNAITLHSRRPFVGNRSMVRVRFNDPNHKTHTVGNNG